MMPDPASLAKNSDSLVYSMVRISAFTGIETKDLQRLLCSLSQSLRHTSKLFTGARSASFSIIIDALRAIHVCLEDLRSFAGTFDKEIDSNSSSAQAYDEADTIVANTTKNSRDHMIILKQTLISCMNTLTLIASLDQGLSNAAEVQEQVQMVQEELRIFSNWIFDRIKDIFQPASATTGDARSEKPPAECCLVFSLHEMEISSQRLPQIVNTQICPAVGLTNVNPRPGKLHNLGFRCFCENENHNAQLKYQVLRDQSLLVEETGPGMDRTWQVLLRKQNVLVSVRLSNVNPKYVNELEGFWNQLATSFVPYAALGSHNANKATLSFSSEQSISVQSMRSGAAFLRLSVLDAQLIKNEKEIHVPLKPGDMRLLHYATASKDLLEGSQNTNYGESRIFSPEMYFLIVFSNRSSSSPRNAVNKTYLYKIPVYENTAISISDFKGPLYVTLTEVNCIHEGMQLNSTNLSKIHFKFSTDTDAKTFLDNIQHMKSRLVEKSLQQTYWGEETVYRRISDEFALGYSQSSKAQLSVISCLQPQKCTSKYRMIITRDNDPGSICIDLGSSFFKQVHEGLAKSLLTNPVRTIWTLDYENLGVPTWKKTKWDRVITRGKEKIRAPHTGGTFITREDETSSNAWFDTLGDLISVLKGRKKPTTKKNSTQKDYSKSDDKPVEIDDRYKPVKIAIIDTGINPEHPQGRNIKFKDFVDKKNMRKKDSTGHGSMLVDLVLKVYEAADIYVARVFETDQADEEKEPDLMAEAIKWASEQEVDIISISAGFKTDVLKLREEIAKASNILIFAAASNWGNLANVAYPARIKDHVFCIFASDGGLKVTGRYNPEPRSNAENFAILGDDVEVYPGKGHVKGTSVATAIAAGLAGRILDFSRHADCRNDIEGVDLIRTKAGMTAIFTAISRRSGMFDCICPDNLLKTNRPRGDRNEKRKDVRANISEALRNVD